MLIGQVEYTNSIALTLAHRGAFIGCEGGGTTLLTRRRHPRVFKEPEERRKLVDLLIIPRTQGGYESKSKGSICVAPLESLKRVAEGEVAAPECIGRFLVSHSHPMCLRGLSKLRLSFSVPELAKLVTGNLPLRIWDHPKFPTGSWLAHARDNLFVSIHDASLVDLGAK